MRIGIVGTGMMGAVHAASWRTTPATLAGFVSRSGASELATQHGVPAFATLEEMLPHIDVVDLCTPTHLHLEQTTLAARAGKPIVCEKPIARTVADAERMLTLCQAQGVRLLLAHVLRYFPAYADVHDQLARGDLGTLQSLSLLRAGSAPAQGWFADLALSGGPLLDLLIHDYDYARWVAGEVATVHAQAAGTLDDHAFVTLTHTSGVVTQLEGGWYLPAGQFRTRMDITGSVGSVHHDNDTLPAAVAAGAVDPYALQAQAQYATLTHGAPARVSARDGVEALRIALAVIESARNGRMVTLSGG